MAGELSYGWHELLRKKTGTSEQVPKKVFWSYGLVVVDFSKNSGPIKYKPTLPGNGLHISDNLSH